MQDRQNFDHVVGCSLACLLQISDLAIDSRVFDIIFQLKNGVFYQFYFLVHLLQVGQIRLEVLLVVPNLLHQCDLEFYLVVLLADAFVGKLLDSLLALE